MNNNLPHRTDHRGSMLLLGWRVHPKMTALDAGCKGTKKNGDAQIINKTFGIKKNNLYLCGTINYG